MKILTWLLPLGRFSFRRVALRQDIPALSSLYSILDHIFTSVTLIVSLLQIYQFLPLSAFHKKNPEQCLPNGNCTLESQSNLRTKIKLTSKKAILTAIR